MAQAVELSVVVPCFNEARCVDAFVAAFLALLFVVGRALLFGDPVGGWPSLVCIIVFFGGLQLFVTGILGAYLAKTYLETKHRPVYIVSEETPGVLVRRRRK